MTTPSEPLRPPVPPADSATVAVKSPSEKPFTVSDMSFGISRQRSAMVVTPTAPMVIDQARLARVGNSSSLSPVEEWLVEEARRRGDGARVLLFRAANSANERVWEFDRRFNEPELQKAGAIMTRALLPLHRALLTSGVVLMVHTDWGRRESYAMRHGVRALTEEITRSSYGSATRRVDEWILRNMLMHVALSLNHVTEKLLPAQIGLIERRWPRVVDLL